MLEHGVVPFLWAGVAACFLLMTGFPDLDDPSRYAAGVYFDGPR